MTKWIGFRNGLITVLERTPKVTGDRDPKFRCICDCGTETFIARSNLRSTKSCGCSFSRYGSLKDRLENNSIPEPNSGCWLWIGGITQNNKSSSSYGAYGKTSLKYKSFKAHRASYETYKGQIPPKMEVCHSCDNPYCINPDHLFIGTHLDNMRDRDRKKRRKPPRGELNGTAKITETDVRRIRASTDIQKNIASRFGIDQTTVSLIRRRKLWSHVS